MTDTPIIDAIKVAARRGAGDTAPAFLSNIVMTALRLANPWTPPDEEIEALSHAIRGWNSRGVALAAYRARPIIRELYDSGGAPR